VSWVTPKSELMGQTVANGSTPKTHRRTRESQKCPNLITYKDHFLFKGVGRG